MTSRTLKTIRPRGRAGRSAFTLVELLVVIGIIGILAAILLPTIGSAFRRAETGRARSEIQSISTAVRAYYNDYSRLPGGNDLYGPSRNNRELINILRAVSGTGNTGHANNPRRTLYIELQEDSLSSSGDFLDPWGNQYRVALDQDYDNRLTSLPEGIGTLEGIQVAVWSLGPDGQSGSSHVPNYVKSW